MLTGLNSIVSTSISFKWYQFWTVMFQTVPVAVSNVTRFEQRCFEQYQYRFKKGPVLDSTVLNSTRFKLDQFLTVISHKVPVSSGTSFEWYWFEWCQFWRCQFWESWWNAETTGVKWSEAYVTKQKQFKQQQRETIFKKKTNGYIIN